MFGSLVGKVARMGPADAFRVGLTMAALLATVLAVTTAAVAVAAKPALADVTGNPPDYVLEEDGTVVIDGDLATDCPSFALALEEGYELGPNNPEQAQAVLEQCEEAGLLGSRGGTLNASASASGSASASSEASAADGEGGGLPETGGPAFPALLVVAVGVVAASGLLAREVAG